MPKIKIYQERCKSCQLCIHFCPKKLLKLSNHTNKMGYHPVTLSNPNDCTGCAICARLCPDVAIEVYK